MAAARLRLIRGRIETSDTFEAPQRGGTRPRLPSLDPAAHRTRLKSQLDAVLLQAQSRPVDARDELAGREIIAVRPAPDAVLTADQLDDSVADDENYENWPILTQRAVDAAEAADPRPRDRVFALAVTRSMQEPPLDDVRPTLWSHAADQLAFREGHGRLLIVSAGNARPGQWLVLAQQHPQLQLSEKIHQPAQAANVLTVGAYTSRTGLPPSLGCACSPTSDCRAPC